MLWMEIVRQPFKDLTVMIARSNVATRREMALAE